MFEGKKRAENYDKLEWTEREEYIRKLIEACNLKSNYVSCDIGTGTGIIAHELANYCGNICGIDISDEMLKIASEKRSNPKIDYVNMNAENMEFDDESFNCITARMCFHHIENQKKAINECYRTLKSGCKFVISEGVPPQGARTFYTNMFKLKEERRTYTIDDLVDLLEHAGFKNINVDVHIMPSVSTKNWLLNAGLDDITCSKIYNMHLDCEDYIKKAYNMKMINGDILMDWIQAIVSGEK